MAIKPYVMSDLGDKLSLHARIQHYCADIKRLIEHENWPVVAVIDVLFETGIIIKKCRAGHLTELLKTLECGDIQYPLPIIYDLYEVSAPPSSSVQVNRATNGGTESTIKSPIVPVFERETGSAQTPPVNTGQVSQPTEKKALRLGFPDPKVTLPFTEVEQLLEEARQKTRDRANARRALEEGKLEESLGL